MTEIIVRRTAAIGDNIAASIVAAPLAAQGIRVVWQSHPDIWPVLKRCPHIATFEAPQRHPHVNLDGCYELLPHNLQRHFCEVFCETTAFVMRQLEIPFSVNPHMIPELLPNFGGSEWRHETLRKFPRPWIFICPGSDFYKTRNIPNDVWSQIAPRLPGTKFWIGLHPAPLIFVDLKLKQLDALIDVLSLADLLITPDTGPMHIAQALGIPMVVIKQAFDPKLRLSKYAKFEVVSADLTCLNCGKHMCPLNQWLPPCQNIEPERVVKAAERLLEKGVVVQFNCEIAQNRKL